MTAAEVKDLMDAAAKAWRHASKRAREVRFRWRGKSYVSTLSAFRMLVDTADGEPVACRFHDWWPRLVDRKGSER